MKVLLVHGNTSESQLKEIRSWLEAEGCEIASAGLTSLSGKTRREAIIEIVDECDVLALLVDVDFPVDGIENVVMAANAKGKEIVSVQLGSSPIHIKAFEKYGSASVPFKQNLIIAAVCKHNPAWLDEDGHPRTDQDMEHHKCKKPIQGKKNEAA
jgi:hypothetical protein